MAASRLTICFAAFVALCSPALAAKTCVIVYSDGTNGNWQEKEEHEFAHALGWTHPVKASAFGKSFPVPERYRKLYRAWKAGTFTPPCRIDAYYVSVADAKKTCNGHFGCAWFE